VTYTPALFVNGERYRGDLDPAAVSAALEAAPPVR
jgi:protein-disulfide isomerase